MRSGPLPARASEPRRARRGWVGVSGAGIPPPERCGVGAPATQARRMRANLMRPAAGSGGEASVASRTAPASQRPRPAFRGPEGIHRRPQPPPRFASCGGPEPRDGRRPAAREERPRGPRRPRAGGAAAEAASRSDPPRARMPAAWEHRRARRARTQDAAERFRVRARVHPSSLPTGVVCRIALKTASASRSPLLRRARKSSRRPTFSHSSAM